MFHLFVLIRIKTRSIPMSIVTNTQSDYWKSHFVALAKEDGTQAEQIDCSSHAPAIQNYAYVLEAVGTLPGKNVLDAGFGTGELSRILDLLGAKVSAIDVVPTRIPLLREQAPSIAWWQADLSEWTLPHNAQAFDVVVALESLQYVDFNDATNRLLSAVAVGGRLVVVVPNADCPIVQRTSEQFDGQYVGVSMTRMRQRITQILQERNDREVRNWRVSYRGISFQADESLAPYRSETWQRFETVQATNSKAKSSQAAGSQISSSKIANSQTTGSQRTSMRFEKNNSRLSAPHLRKTATPPNRLQIVFQDSASASR